MTTVRFSKMEFEAALPSDKHSGKPLWKYVGLEYGEHQYLVPLVGKERIAVLVRSSVGPDGFAADTGENSIRLVLVDSETGRPLAKKVDAWTQRTPGWEERMADKIRELYQKGLQMAVCPKCGGIMLPRTGRNGSFYGCSNFPRCRFTVNSLAALDKSVEKDPDNDVAEFLDNFSNEAPSPEVVDALDEGDVDAISDYTEERATVKEPSAQQKVYIEAPVDANICVMAGPGSGKTFSSVERIVYLIEHGVDPNAIVYVTLTKSMATEGMDRISRRLSSVNDTLLGQQICTIHALCYRMLRWEGVTARVPKEWEVKKALTAIIAGDDREGVVGIWKDAFEKPGYKEVLYWIDVAKRLGLRSNEDFALFRRHMSYDQAEKVHRARTEFDVWMKKMSYLTFSDMMFEVEQRLIHDRQFREKYQKRFSHVLVDEAQDTNEQALRILITLSFEPGDNRLYNRFMSHGW